MIDRETLLAYVHAHNRRVYAQEDEDRLGKIVAEALVNQSSVVTDDDGSAYVVERQTFYGISVAPRVTHVAVVR